MPLTNHKKMQIYAIEPITVKVVAVDLIKQEIQNIFEKQSRKGQQWTEYKRMKERAVSRVNLRSLTCLFVIITQIQKNELA